MNRFVARLQRDEQGAALLIVLAFIAFIGALAPALLDYTSTNLRATVQLREDRNEQYATDAFAELAIAKFRADTGRTLGDDCFVDTAIIVNDKSLRVQCTGTSTNTTFTVCPTTAICTATEAKLVATVRFDNMAATSPLTITSWSVRT